MKHRRGDFVTVIILYGAVTVIVSALLITLGGAH
jgi:hypothetical protein